MALWAWLRASVCSKPGPRIDRLPVRSQSLPRVLQAVPATRFPSHHTSTKWRRFGLLGSLRPRLAWRLPVCRNAQNSQLRLPRDFAQSTAGYGVEKSVSCRRALSIRSRVDLPTSAERILFPGQRRSPSPNRTPASATGSIRACSPAVGTIVQHLDHEMPSVPTIIPAVKRHAGHLIFLPASSPRSAVCFTQMWGPNITPDGIITTLHVLSPAIPTPASMTPSTGRSYSWLSY